MGTAACLRRSLPQIKADEERKRTLTAVYETLERACDTQSAVLNRQTLQARQMLRKLLDGKIAVEPVTVDGRRGFRLSAKRGSALRAEVLRAIEATTSDEANSPTVVAPTGNARETVQILVPFEAAAVTA